MLTSKITGSHFRSNITLRFDDLKFEESYKLTKYKYSKYFSAGIFFILYGIINIALYSHFLKLSEGTDKEKLLSMSVLYIQVSILLIQIFGVILFIFFNYKLKAFRPVAYYLLSILCTIGVYLDSHITREYSIFLSMKSYNSYTIPFLHSVLVTCWILFFENSYLINFISCFISYILIGVFSIGFDWSTSDGIIFLIISLFLYPALAYIVERSDKNMFYINNTIQRELDNTKEVVNNLNAGIVTVTRDCLMVTYNNKVKLYLSQMFQSQADSESIPLTINVKQFLVEGIEVSQDISQHIIKVFKSDIDISNEDEINMILAKLFEYTNFTQYAYLGNKKYRDQNLKEYTIRMYIRFNTMRDSLDFILEDISNIIDVENLKAQDKYKNLFLNKFSHEFKNPLLNVVQLVKNIKNNGVTSRPSNSILSTYCQNKKENNKELNYIKNLCKYMLNLIHDFDYVSKVNIRSHGFEARKSQVGFKPELKNLDLRKIVKNTVDLFRTRVDLAEKDLKIFAKISESVPLLINSDGQRLQQVLFNLMSNSFKFTSYGEIFLSVRLTPQEFIEFTITDSGQGMSEETKKKICSPFFKNDTNHNMYGIGLGLFIVKSILAEMNSSIVIESSPNSGTRISFCLPSKHKTVSFKRVKTMAFPNILKRDSEHSSIKKFNDKFIITTTEGKQNDAKLARTRTAFPRYSIKKIDELDDRASSSRSQESMRTFKSIVKEKPAPDGSFQTKSTVVLNTLHFDFEKFNNQIEGFTFLKEIADIGSPILPHRRRTLQKTSFGLDGNNDASRRQSFVFEDDALNILVVDDEKLIRQSNTGVLNKYFNSIKKKINIVECSDGAECLYKLFLGTKTGITYHIIITDETMNFMRGSMTSKLIRGLVDDGVLYELNIFMVTSYEPSVIDSKYPHIFKQIFTKPLTKDNVKEMYSILDMI
jgi:signal transduction histidine kinase/CheY-like chemotaxis protein